MKCIEVRAGQSQESVLDGRCDLVESAETLKEARARARYVLSPEYARYVEMAVPFSYSQVLVDGECVSDFFRH